ncbi:hypothetical protein KRM28CT15_53540 [Krasilnikovia sp. M28-CT-15]
MVVSAMAPSTMGRFLRVRDLMAVPLPMELLMNARGGPTNQTAIAAGEAMPPLLAMCRQTAGVR